MQMYSLICWGSLQSAETEEVAWMGDDMFLTLGAPHPDELNQLFGIPLPG